MQGVNRSPAIDAHTVGFELWFSVWFHPVIESDCGKKVCNGNVLNVIDVVFNLSHHQKLVEENKSYPITVLAVSM